MPGTEQRRPSSLSCTVAVLGLSSVLGLWSLRVECPQTMTFAPEHDGTISGTPSDACRHTHCVQAAQSSGAVRRWLLLTAFRRSMQLA